jgi:hypothetical protein
MLMAAAAARQAAISSSLTASDRNRSGYRVAASAAAVRFRRAMRLV